MNVGEYLKSNFPGGVSKYEEITVNGEVKGYYVKGSNGDEMYLPANVTGNVGMLSYIPGSGGSGNDAARIRDRIHGGNPPEYPITIAASCSDHQNAIEVGYKMAQGANMNVTNNVTVCFSASGYLGIGRTESFEDNHPDVVSTVISCEPYGEGNYKYNKDESNRDGLIKSNSQVIFVAPQKGFHIDMAKEIAGMTEAGMNAYFLGTAYSGNSGSVHIRTNADVLTSGMVDYLLGYADNFNQDPGDNYSPNYKLIRYNSELKEYQGMNYEDLASGALLVRVPDLAKLKAVDSFDIKKVASPVQEKYAVFKSIEPKQLQGVVMETNHTYAFDQMNSIRAMIKSSSFLDSCGNMTCRSTSGIPGCIAGYLNAYYDIVGSLMNDLLLETDSIMSYTQAVVDLDNDLANGKASGSIVEDAELKGFIPIGLPEETKTEETDTTTTTTTTTPGDTTSGTTTGGTTWTGGTTTGGTTTGGTTTGGTTTGGTTTGGTTTGGTTTGTTTTTTTTTTSTEPSTQPTTQPTTEPATEPAQQPTETVVVPAQPEQPAGQPYVEAVQEDGGDHSGAGLDELPPDVENDMDLEADMDADTVDGRDLSDDITGMDEGTTSSPVDMVSEPSMTRIPVQETPVQQPTTKKSSPVVPVVAGLTIAAAAGIGAKAYMDHQKNNDNGEEEKVDPYDDYYQDDEYTTNANTVDVEYDDSYGDENTVAEEGSYTARSSDELADMQ